MDSLLLWHVSRFVGKMHSAMQCTTTRVEPGLGIHLTLRGHSWSQLYWDGQKGVQNDFLLVDGPRKISLE